MCQLPGKIWWPLLISIIFITCEPEQPEKLDYLKIPQGFPDMEFPLDNQFSSIRFELGRKLFFDPVLSRDSSISCASCHRQELAFTDGRRFSLGVDLRIGHRNAPSLANVGYHPYLLREGGVPTLEMQILVPIQEHNEFDENILVIAEKLNRSKLYRELSMEAYERLPDPFVITRSIACFERALVSGNSSFDQYLHGDSKAISESALRGYQLFKRDSLNCIQCHSGFNFTNYGFFNNGLYEVYNDVGRMRFTGKEEDRSLFKVPSLRNVALTAPYMFDGSFESLEQVIEHYASGGKNNPQKSKLINGFHISNEDKMDLIHFLQSLSDEQFISNPNFNLK